MSAGRSLIVAACRLAVLLLFLRTPAVIPLPVTHLEHAAGLVLAVWLFLLTWALVPEIVHRLSGR